MKKKFRPLFSSLKKFSLKKIRFKITLMIWGISIFSIIAYIGGTLPYQRTAARERMNNEAKDITNSIGQVAANAIISEEYSFVVEHCLNVLKQTQSLVYVVITKNDGFSLIQHSDSWSRDTLNGNWKDENLVKPRSEIIQNEFSKGQEVYSYSTLLHSSGINLGWIHVGLSLKKYNDDNAATTKRSIILTIICSIIGLLVAFIFTKKLILPITILDTATKKVADGNLTVSAIIETGDELQSLADSFNKMTKALLLSRNEILSANEFTNNIISSLNDTLIVCDVEWNITKVNIATEDLLQYTEDELIGKKIDMIFDDQSALKFQNNFKFIDSEDLKDKYYNDELYYLSKDGSGIPVLFSSSVLLDNDKKIAGYTIIALDITERKNAEVNLRKAHDELEMRVWARTQELEELNSKLISEINTRITAEDKIKSSLHEKEILLKEIHHRVKNNLQVISSLLYLQSKKIVEKEYKFIFNESQNRIKSMALVHEKLYKSEDLAGIELGDYTRSLISYLMRSYDISTHMIKYELNVDNIFLPIDIAIPFGLIINELITNSLKYAFIGRDDGFFRIVINRDDEGIFTASIFDNGVGLPHDFEINKTSSLGLRLVQTLVSQIEGSLDIMSNGGTEFIIKFDESHKSKS